MSQTINLGNIKTVRYNSTDMAEMKLNSSSIWVGQTELTISSNTNNYDIGAAVLAAGGDKATNVQLTINSGVTVGSTSSSTAAMYTGTGWSSGTTINITNNGSIVGSAGQNVNSSSGGSGGGGGRGFGYNECGTYGYTSGGSGSSGSGSADVASNGGDAFEHSQTGSYLSVIFDTAGTRTGGSAGTTTIQGGGGGGGGGGKGTTAYPGAFKGGSGGGGGASGGSGGAGGCNLYCGDGGCGNAGSNPGGSNGGSSSGGSGGAGGGGVSSGGSGGGLGSSGSSGYNLGYGSGGGGSAGSTGYASGSSGSALSGNTGQIS